MMTGMEAVAADSPTTDPQGSGSPQGFGNPLIFRSRTYIQHQLGLILVVCAVVVLLASGWTWSQTPDYKVLFSNVSGRDGGAIIASLQQMNVPYKYAEDAGAILVPVKKVHDARLKLAAQGLPATGLVGFDLMLSSHAPSSWRP